MKWNNRGHEFDEVYENIRSCQGFYLFGAGHDGAMVQDILLSRYQTIPVLGFLDNDESKQGGIFKGMPVYAPQKALLSEGAGIIVSFASEMTGEIDRQLSEMGLVLGKDFWHYEEFLSVVAAYAYDEWFVPSISFIPITACNLRCEACLNFTTYCSRFEVRPLEEVKADLDLFFAHIDYIGLLLISGGEPLLYPHLAECMRYIMERYSSKIYSLETVTNGTVTPPSAFLEALRELDIKITVDDYRDALPEYRDSFEKNLELLLKYGGSEKVISKKYDTWIDLYPYSQKEKTPEELTEKYSRCHVPWQEYYKGRLYTCNYASFAAKTGITPPIDAAETYDLRAHTRKNVKEAAEFRAGYSQKGYAQFCRQCAGYVEINPHKVRPAVQKREE